MLIVELYRKYKLRQIEINKAILGVPQMRKKIFVRVPQNEF